MSALEVTAWKPPMAELAGEVTRPAATHVWRGSIAIGVVAMHFLALSLLSLSAPDIGDATLADSYEVIEARLVDEQLADERLLIAPIVRLELLKEPQLEISQLPASAFNEDAPAGEHAAIASGQFLPPRRENSDGNVISLPSSSVAPGKRARAILRIEVLDSGATGRVQVEITSGVDALDEAAAEFARSIRWIPASNAGQATTMWVRLPMLFTSAS